MSPDRTSDHDCIQAQPCFRRPTAVEWLRLKSRELRDKAGAYEKLADRIEHLGLPLECDETLWGLLYGAS